MTKYFVIAAVLLSMVLWDRSSSAQIGERIDRGLERIGRDLREGWEEARSAVNRMGVQGRVYSRIRWDKELEDATIDIEVENDDVVVLSGSAPSEAAKRKAEKLAEETVGVARVVNRLGVAAPAAESP